VIKHLKGSINSKSTVRGKLRGFRIVERIKYNKKAIIITLTISSIALLIGVFIPFTLIVTVVGLIVIIVTTFCLPPTKEREINKTEV
jgi:uncharacterized membrane protein